MVPGAIHEGFHFPPLMLISPRYWNLMAQFEAEGIKSVFASYPHYLCPLQSNVMAIQKVTNKRFRKGWWRAQTRDIVRLKRSAYRNNKRTSNVRLALCYDSDISCIYASQPGKPLSVSNNARYCEVEIKSKWSNPWELFSCYFNRSEPSWRKRPKIYKIEIHKSMSESAADVFYPIFDEFCCDYIASHQK